MSGVFKHFLNELAARFGDPLPGVQAQLKMAPEHRLTPEHADVSGKNCREAAVSLLLFAVDDAPALVLTHRHADLSSHGGQVSLPGGRVEPAESHLQAALRETFEEVGIPTDTPRLIGSLTPLYVPPSNYCVFPFVFALEEPPVFTVDPLEVQELLIVSVDDLLNPVTRQEERRQLHGGWSNVPYYQLGVHRVWGATAMILSEFIAILQK